jgi:hypothetical protein
MYLNIDEKNISFIQHVKFLQFLIVKSLDPDPRWPKMLDPDPALDPQHWIRTGEIFRVDNNT